METGALLSKLSKAVPGAVLEKQRFGRSESLCLWIESGRTAAVAKALVGLGGAGAPSFDWLEHLSVMQVDAALVLTYFLRSSSRPDTLILRSSVEPATMDAEVELPSVREIWRMAEPMEREVSELFGIRFVDTAGGLVEKPTGRLPRNPAVSAGFPLRKNFATCRASGIAELGSGERGEDVFG